MNARRPDITPDTKVGALLEHYPEVEETLIGLSPEFRRLKNPILRRTLARIATLRQVARIGEVPLGTLITRLRDAAGMVPGESGAGLENKENSMSHSDPASYEARPDWVSEPVKTFDAREIIEGGGHPLEVVMKDLAALPDGGIYELITPFVPAPLIDMARGRGFEAWSEPPASGTYRTFFRRA